MDGYTISQLFLDLKGKPSKNFSNVHLLTKNILSVFLEYLTFAILV